MSPFPVPKQQKKQVIGRDFAIPTLAEQFWC
jgi:hypothetical protein